MDTPLRNALWDALTHHFFRFQNSNYDFESTLAYQTKLLIWQRFLHRTADEYSNSSFGEIRDFYMQASWHEVYDIIQFCADLHSIYRIQFIEECSSILERELSGYRFVNGLLVPLTNSEEISGVTNAIETTGRFTSMSGANTHLEDALKKIALRDFRNSIKESISAVEVVAKVLANSPNDTLGAALAILKNSIGLNEALIRGFKAIYGYTSDADGIRHGLMDEATCDVEDARFMLVACSAFVNYLIEKGQKAGLL